MRNVDVDGRRARRVDGVTETWVLAEADRLDEPADHPPDVAPGTRPLPVLVPGSVADIRECVDRWAAASAPRVARICPGPAGHGYLDPAGPLARLGDHPGLLVTPHVGWYSERSARILRQRTITESIAATMADEDGGTA